MTRMKRIYYCYRSQDKFQLRDSYLGHPFVEFSNTNGATKPTNPIKLYYERPFHSHKKICENFSFVLEL